MSTFTQRWWAIIRLLAMNNQKGTISEEADSAVQAAREQCEETKNQIDDVLIELTRNGGRYGIDG